MSVKIIITSSALVHGHGTVIKLVINVFIFTQFRLGKKCKVTKNNGLFCNIEKSINNGQITKTQIWLAEIIFHELMNCGWFYKVRNA